VARTVSTGLSGVPAGGRPSFLGGLGQGARAEQQAQATQQSIKFKTFQDQVQAAQLHNEDLRMQYATDDHQDAVQDRADAEAKRMTGTTGMTYTEVPNTAANVKTYMDADQQQNGGASVPSGVIFGPHTLYIPNKGSADQAKADTTNYNSLAPAYGLPPAQPGQVVNPGANNLLRQTRNGMDQQGHPMSATDIGNRVDNLTSYLKANSGISDDAKAAVQSDIDHLTDLQTHHAARDQQGIDQATTNKAASTAANANAGLPAKEALQQNAAANKAANAKPQNLDTNGNPAWVPGVTAMEKNKAELGENIAGNANAVASIIMKRPDILGAVAGKFTSAEQMIGNNDPDISALGTRIQNIAKANAGIHGLRSNEGIIQTETMILNNFKNGPKAVIGALKATTGSAQTFVDNARPNTYKTHSKNGGVSLGMGAQ
jgi:hypothetical protein